MQRSARYSVDLPLTFIADGVEVAGHAINVSQSGVLARFSEPLELWITGDLAMLVGEYYVTLPAKVARVQEGEFGMAFVQRTENDERAVGILMEYAEMVNPGGDGGR